MQTVVAFLVVAAAIGYLGERFWRKYASGALARFFLKRGKVAVAMKLKRQSKAGCSDCR